MAISNPFRQPGTHDQRLIAEATRKANLSGIQISKDGGAALMPQTINLGFSVLAENVRQYAVASAGYAALSRAPTSAGFILTLPVQPVYLGGRIATLAGDNNTNLTYDFSGAAANTRWTVVVEWYESVVIPSTVGANPVAIAGIASSQNKPNTAGFYPGGNQARNTAPETISDAPMGAGTTVQSQRYTQPQYIVRTGNDASLVGVAPTIVGGLPVWVTNPEDISGVSVRSSDPTDYLPSSPTPKTSDGYFYAAKLCTLERTATGLLVYNDTAQPYPALGQLPVGVALSNSTTNTIVRNLTTQVIALSNEVIAFDTRLDAAEADVIAGAASLATHIGLATDAHDASAVSITPIAGVVGDDVQEVLANLRAQIAVLQGSTDGKYIRVSGHNFYPTINVFGNNNDMNANAFVGGGTPVAMPAIGPGGAAAPQTIGKTGAGAYLTWPALDLVPATAKAIRVRVAVAVRNSGNLYKFFVVAPTAVSNVLSLSTNHLTTYGVELALLTTGTNVGNDHIASAHMSIDVDMPPIGSLGHAFQAGLWLSAGINGAAGPEFIQWSMVLEGYYP